MIVSLDWLAYVLTRQIDDEIERQTREGKKPTKIYADRDDWYLLTYYMDFCQPRKPYYDPRISLKYRGLEVLMGYGPIEVR